MKAQPVTCPCCRRKVNHGKMKKTFSRFPFDGMMAATGATFEESFVSIVGQYPDFYQWACDDCLQSGRALLGQPAKQFYTFGVPWDTASPYFAYFDRTRRCEKCKQDFVFTKEEQQYWYEKLQFVVYSVPNTCKPCGRSRTLNNELSALLRDGLPDELDTLQRIAAIYAEMGKPEKQKAYQAEIRKLQARG